MTNMGKKQKQDPQASNLKTTLSTSLRSFWSSLVDKAHNDISKLLVLLDTSLSTELNSRYMLATPSARATTKSSKIEIPCTANIHES